jgi:predicted Zn-dependent protease
MKNKFIILIFLLSLFSLQIFSSARYLTFTDYNYYYETIGKNILEYPYVFETELKNYVKNYFYIKLPIKHENILSNNYDITRGWYSNTQIYDTYFREILLENAEIFTLGFKGYYYNDFYYQFFLDVYTGETSYFIDGKIVHFYELAETFEKFSMDMPKYSYFLLKRDSFELSVGRTPLSLGPMYYDLTLSKHIPYYDNINLNLNFDSLNWKTALLSMVPFLDENEYAIAFEDPDFVAMRNAVYHGFVYNYEKINFGASLLNYIGGKKLGLHNLFFAETGSIGSFVNYNSFLDINFENAFNYNNKKHSLAVGISKDLDFNKIKLLSSIEYYYVEKDYFEHEIPYKSLYYRTFVLSNSPGMRKHYDYPLGFFYGDDASVFHFNNVIAFEKGYVRLINDFGKNKFGDLKKTQIKALYNFLIGDFSLSYIDIKSGDKDFSSFKISYDIILELGI